MWYLPNFSNILQELGGPQSVLKPSALLSRKRCYLCEALVTVMSTLPNVEEKVSPRLPPQFQQHFAVIPQAQKFLCSKYEKLRVDLNHELLPTCEELKEA